MRGLIFAGALGESGASSACLGARARAKPLILISDKPMIYYPLSVLLLAGIKHILIISTPQDTPLFQKLLGDGSQWGINVSYAVQPTAQGLAQAFIIGAEFIGNHTSALIRGDNIFYGEGFADSLKNAATLKKGARILAYPLSDPEKQDGVVFDENGKVYALPERVPERVPEREPEREPEKPPAPKSDYAVTGLCFYDSSVAQRARSIKFSASGELAITALNKTYLDDDLLYVDALTHETAWFNIETDESLLDATRCIEAAEQGQAMKVGCPEEICWRKGYIDDGQLENLAMQMQMNDYGKYLKALLGGTDALKGVHGTLSE